MRTLSHNLTVTVLLLFVAIIPSWAGCSLYGLTCEQLSNPVGIDSERPRFSWKIKSDIRGFRQKAYRIMVASTPELLNKKKPDIWDSGNVRSDSSVMVGYRGVSLRPATTYYWKVMIKGSDGNSSAFSGIQQFTTGLFTTSDWHGARWIAMERDGEIMVPAVHGHLGGKEIGRYVLPIFRKEFNINKKVSRALLFISGLGHFDCYINGGKVDKHFLDPLWTKYDKEALYLTFDISDRLTQGGNAIGVMLGNGFYNIPNERYYKLTGSYGAPKMIARLRIIYDDNSEDNIISDTSWSCMQGPITFSSIFGGEDYDATKVAIGWKNAGYNDTEWEKPVLPSNGNLPQVLKAQCGTHMAELQHLKVVNCKTVRDSLPVFDFGQNMSGVPRMTIKGKPGSTVTLIPGELLNPDGTVNQSASGSPYFFRYTIGSDSAEQWQPQFTYYGYRYVQVEGAVPAGEDNPRGLPEILQMEGVHTGNSAPQAGRFVCSKPMFNSIYNLIDWAMRSNMAGVLTDCPHREKLGWQEEAYLMQPSLQYRYDLSSLYRKILNDMATAQYGDGIIPSIVPEYVRFADGFENSPEWGSSFIIGAWQNYLWYGDIESLRNNYTKMKKYLSYLHSRADNYIVAYGLGDWYDIGPRNPGYSQLTSNGVTATAIFYQDALAMTEVARVLGHEDDAQEFATLADNIKKAYNETFYKDAEGYYDRNSQTANAMSLYLGLADGQRRQSVAQALIDDIKSRKNGLTAGDIGYRYVLKALETLGRDDVIYDMNSRYDAPGYGWQLAHGATALTESWQAYGFVSNNHFMLGHLMEWLFSGLGGVKQAEGSVAFRHLLIAPTPVRDVTWAKTTYNSPYGEVRCEWDTDVRQQFLRVSVPANCTATVKIPFAITAGRQVCDYGIPLPECNDIKVIPTADGTLTLEVGSGEYLFETVSATCSATSR